MNKGNSGFSDYKGDIESNIHHEKPSPSLPIPIRKINEKRLKHVTRGDFNNNNRPIGGGHGQDNIEYMEKNNIPYVITKEYTNGVRVGNLPTAVNKKFRYGSNHTWFPKEWTSVDIANAANYVASKYKKTPLPRISCKGIYKGVRVVVVFGTDGDISTAFPDKNQGGIKND